MKLQNGSLRIEEYGMEQNLPDKNRFHPETHVPRQTWKGACQLYGYLPYHVDTVPEDNRI
jgi:hypothetical protein